MVKNVRVRFAPSPTGGLHLGGVRTVLYNYLFAKQHGGKFILRIEDTDQTRFVPGAEAYIRETLEWCGLQPDESPWNPGDVGPYRQSERKALYRKYADQLVEAGYAYYAFDTPDELEAMRQQLRTNENPSPQYDAQVRMQMRNSLSLSEEETSKLLVDDTPYVIRLKMPAEEITLHDMIRGEVTFDAAKLDDKVLLKADGMPTYHLAVVVDDYHMQISHAFRGEEWLPSAPAHVLLWRYLFGEDKMPQWAHLPLILGPEGKLSKRDGARYGFPVFAMNWKDPKSGELTEGFRERGFLPVAFVNMLAMLGWNDGTDQELFSPEELVKKFSIEKVHKAGAKFDYEKAKWFNHEWIKRADPKDLATQLPSALVPPGFSKDRLEKIISLVQDRLSLLTDFDEQAGFFFKSPGEIDFSPVKSKWNESKQAFMQAWTASLTSVTPWTAASLEEDLKTKASEQGLKAGELQLPLRLMLVGGKFGPPVFEIAAVLGVGETTARILNGLNQLAD